MLLTTFINRFEKSYGTFGIAKGNFLLSMTLGQFVSPQKNLIYFLKNNNDHGVDVNIIIVI
jgi:hypothetical protein